jgi:hypothetical protein
MFYETSDDHDFLSIGHLREVQFGEKCNSHPIALSKQIAFFYANVWKKSATRQTLKSIVTLEAYQLLSSKTNPKNKHPHGRQKLRATPTPL